MIAFTITELHAYAIVEGDTHQLDVVDQKTGI
jgi:hypothetical protein